MLRITPPQGGMNPEQAAKQIITALISTAKKINLYSESHTVYHNALKILKNMLDVYFNSFGNFRIHIQRYQIIYNNEMVYQGSSEPFDLAFLLHRDGILWIEFQIGLELFEIDTFFRILKDHSLLAQEPEDDIVSALWEFNLPSILFEAAELELDLQDDLDINLAADENIPNRAAEKNEAYVHNDNLYSNLASLIFSEGDDGALWQFTPEERNQLRKMIAAEEKLDGSDFVLDALLYILEEHPLEEDIEALLDTLLQELLQIMMNARFDYLQQIFVKLKKMADRFARSNWMTPYLDQLFASISSPSFLNCLLKISVEIHNFDETAQKQLKHFLLMLDPSAILALGPIVLKTKSVELQDIILETMRFMAATDFRPLEKLITEADAALICRIVHLLGSLKDYQSYQILSSLLRHPSERVRLQALKVTMMRDPQAINDIFPLLDDPDDRVRSFVLKQLGSQRNEAIERKMLAYLNTYRLRGNNSDHFLAVCRTLGQCGSERSIPYLSRLLFKWPLMGILRSAGSPQRQGAIVALEALSTKKSSILIKRHHRGFFRNVLRSATYHCLGEGTGELQNVQ